MRTLATALLGLAVALSAAAEDKKKDEKKVSFKVTADENAKEFKDDPDAAKKKYAGAEIQLTGTATLAMAVSASPAKSR